MKARAQEMVQPVDGCGRVSYVAKSRMTTPTPLKDSTDLMRGAQRLGSWKAASGQWVVSEQTEHMNFVHAIVNLERNGRPWAEVREIEIQYRRGIFTKKFISWSPERIQRGALFISTSPFRT